MTSAKRHHRCILGTCCVPWDESFQFMEAVFRRSVRHQICSGITDLYIFGTAGEGFAVTERQFDEITRVFFDEISQSDARGMVGVMSQSLPVVIERIERTRELGARQFQLSLPSWGVLSDAEVNTFFRETCGRFPDCSFLHYNLMRAGRILSGAEYGVLAARHENLVATKNSTADEKRLHSLLTEAPQLLHFITEVGFAKAALIGECGFLISFLSTNFQRAADYFRAGCAQDVGRLKSISAEFDGLITCFKEAVEGLAHMDGAFDKMFCRVHAPDFPLRLLPPYECVSEQRFRRYVTLLRQNHPHWLP
jgi:dihydrodipicolinate synthase/N-acetylneuraminate lyase